MSRIQLCAGLGKRLAPASLLIASFVMAGCTVMTEAITDEEREKRVVNDFKTMFDHMEPVKGPMDFAEVVARAVRYNLDNRLKITEQALAAGELRVARYDMLPKIVGEASYNGRDNFRGSSSRSLITGEQSLEASTSEDRDREIGKLTAVWNLLDFGVAYARAQQASDQVLIARERTRRVLDNIMLDVRNAFWQAVAAQQILGEIDVLINRVRSAVDRSRQVERRRLQDPLTSLTYQRELLETLRKLVEERRTLAIVKDKLAALINLRPSQKYSLVIPKFDVRKPPKFDAKIAELEHKALVDRPELREEDYLNRIHRAEIRKAYFRMFPRVELEASLQTDSNSFLFNNEWAEWHAKISYNLVRLFRGPAEVDWAQAQVNVSDARRLALSMAILAQVRISYEQYQLAIDKHRFASDLESVDSRILKLSKDLRASNLADELELIRRASNQMLSRIELYAAYTEIQQAYGRIRNSVGRDPLPMDVKAPNMETLAAVVRKSEQTFRSELFGLAKAEPVSQPRPSMQPADVKRDQPANDTMIDLTAEPAPVQNTPDEPTRPADEDRMARLPAETTEGSKKPQIASLPELRLDNAPDSGLGLDPVKWFRTYGVSPTAEPVRISRK